MRSMSDPPAPQIAVSGGGSCTDRERRLAVEVGRELGRRGAILLCGGHGGVMAAAVEGARAAGGLTVGILPGSPGDAGADPALAIRVHTAMGQARNQILVRSADAVIAVGGEWGTLSEIALAVKQGIPVISLDSWLPEREGLESRGRLLTATTALEAVELALGAVADARTV